MSVKKLLVVGYVWPEPNSSAAGSRMLQLIACFQSAGYQVTYASAADISPHAIDLASINVCQKSIVLNCSSFDKWVAEVQPDVVLYDRFMMEEQFGWRVSRACPHALQVLDMEDVHCLRHARHEAVKQGEIFDGVAAPMSDIALREVASILRCDITLVISEYEMEWLQSTFAIPAQLLHYSPFMIEHVVPELQPSFEQRQHFIAIGNFRHAPNWDAVLQLKQCWPAIRAQLPQVELHIYGAYPPPKATQLHNTKQGFMVKGWCDDAFDVIKHARVMLAPLRFGAGLKGKLLDAAQCQTPAITSSIGAEGMYGDLEAMAKICDTESEFIAQAVSLYQSKPQWQLLSEAGAQLIPKRFSMDYHCPLLIELITRVQQQLEQHRRTNFYGAMLRHHSMRSTQYMGQWIEVKNRLQEYCK
ncbi:MAG: glycosyltransferase [Thalassolituus oleivorans]|nr:glycosyltransferase [Thalassolituus oleivorans]MBQ0725989.1 glycosyltransferase [Thalassolituus oleivorans]MBQ0781983.1 glycosyltransferase [Thalassolituus oleivorans]